MRRHTPRYVMLCMLALLISPCYGETTTFLGKTLNGDMKDWGETCAVIYTETSNGTHYINCNTDRDKCTGEYIKRHQIEEDWGPATCTKRNEAYENEIKILAIVGGFAILSTLAFFSAKVCRRCWGKTPPPEPGEGGSTVVDDSLMKRDPTIISNHEPKPQSESADLREPGIDKRSGYDYTIMRGHMFEEGSVSSVPRSSDKPKSVQMPNAESQRDNTMIGCSTFNKKQKSQEHINIQLAPDSEMTESFRIEKAEENIAQFVPGGGEVEESSHIEKTENNIAQFDGRRLLQNETTILAEDTSAYIALLQRWTVPDRETHEEFSNAILEYTGTPPIDLRFPASRHARKMLENTGGMCGFVNITMPGTPGKITYAHTACKTIVSENITMYAFRVDILTMDKNNTWHIDPSWNILTSRYPRLGHPADARQHKDVLSWIHPEEKQVVAYPYLSFGNFIPYNQADDAGSTLENEGLLQMKKDLHAQKIAHPNHWDVSAGGGGGIFSRETMTTLHAVMERVETVTTAANAGDYLSYSGEFPHSTIRDPQRVCAGIVKYGAWGQSGFRGDIKTEPFVEGRNYCGAIKPRTGLPSTKLMMETGFHMYAGLSNVMDAAVRDFVSSGARSRDDWYWLSRLSLAVMDMKMRTLHYVWTFGAKLQPEYTH